jgi:hypothetical protein
VKSLVLVVLFPSLCRAAGELVPVPEAAPTAAEAPASLLARVEDLTAEWDSRGDEPSRLAEDVGFLLHVAALDPLPERRAASRLLLWALTRRTEEAAAPARLGQATRKALERAGARVSRLPADERKIRSMLETLRGSFPDWSSAETPAPQAPVVATARATRLAELALERLPITERTYDTTEDALRKLEELPAAERAQVLHLFMDGAFTQAAAADDATMLRAAVVLSERLESLTRSPEPGVDAAFRRAIRLMHSRRAFSVERKPWDAGAGATTDALSFAKAFKALATAVQRRPDLLDADGARAILDALRTATELLDAGSSEDAKSGKDLTAYREMEPLFVRLARTVEDARPYRPDVFGPELDEAFRVEFAKVAGSAAPVSVRRHAAALAEALSSPSSTALVLVEPRSAVAPRPPSRWDGIRSNSIWSTGLGVAAAGIAALADGPYLLIGLGAAALTFAVARLTRAQPAPPRLPPAPVVPDQDVLEAHRQLDEEFPK